MLFNEVRNIFMHWTPKVPLLGIILILLMYQTVFTFIENMQGLLKIQ